MQLSTDRSTKSFADILCTIMVLCRGRMSNGTPFWAYMCMLPTQARMFHDARMRGKLDLDDYGTIIEWGEGEEPPHEIKERMKNQFGMRDDYEEQLLKVVAQMG